MKEKRLIRLLNFYRRKIERLNELAEKAKQDKALLSIIYRNTDKTIDLYNATLIKLEKL